MKTSILAIFLIFAATACSDNNSNSVECDVSKTLVDGFCVAAQCSADEVNVGGVCLEVTEIPCVEDNECSGLVSKLKNKIYGSIAPTDRVYDAICMNNVCTLKEDPIDDCANVTCTEDQVCIAGSCVVPEPPCLSGDAGCAIECQSASDCTAAVNPDCTTSESCKCEENLCVPIPPIGCAADEDCGPNGVCVDSACQEKPVTTIVDTDVIGTASGDAFDQTCKRDTFALRLKARHGWFMDNLNVGCQDALNRVSNSTKYLKPAGGMGGAEATIIPPNDVMLTGMNASICTDANGSIPCNIQFVGKKMTSKQSRFEAKLNPARKTSPALKEGMWLSPVLAQAPKESFTSVTDVKVACPIGKSLIGIKGTTRAVSTGGPVVVTSMQGICDDTPMATSMGTVKAGASCKDDLSCETGYCGSRPFRSTAAGKCELKMLNLPIINPLIASQINDLMTDTAAAAPEAVEENAAAASQRTLDEADEAIEARLEIKKDKAKLKNQKVEETSDGTRRNPAAF